MQFSTLADLRAAREPDGLAFAGSGRRLTNADLLDRVQAVTGQLRTLGIGNADVVALADSTTRLMVVEDDAAQAVTVPPLRVVTGGCLERRNDTAAVLVGGWLHTGDVGQLDSEGYLRIVQPRPGSIVRAGAAMGQ